MILINKTKTEIQSFHRREALLLPGENNVDESTLTPSERAMIHGLMQAGLVVESKTIEGKLGTNIIAGDESTQSALDDAGVNDGDTIVIDAAPTPLPSTRPETKRKRAK